MASIDILNKLKNRNPGIKNIVLFVSDALRWDYLPESIAQRGLTFKTIAASLFTASSFPSIVTGLYPPAHGVHSFTDRLPVSIASLMNLSGYNTSFWNESIWIRIKHGLSGYTPIHRILRQNSKTTLDEIATPFIYLEDDKGGHCPYGWTEDEDYEPWSCVKFFRDYGSKNTGELRKKYRTGIEQSTEVFEKRLDTLKRRGLAEETLVIFTSDHGELLGEYGGHVGHGTIACPELVYVPTVFIHPSLPCGMSFANEGIIRHVDLFPTILDILNCKLTYPVDGVSLLTKSEMLQVGYNYLEVKTKIFRKIMPSYRYKQISVWDKDGGHKFCDSSFIERLLYSISETMVKGNTAIYLRGRLRSKYYPQIFKNYFTVIKNCMDSYIKHGFPHFNKQYAMTVIRNIDNSEKAIIKRSISKLKKNVRI